MSSPRKWSPSDPRVAYSILPMKWNSISGGFVKKSVPNFHFTEFPFLNEMFSEIHPEFPFSQSGSLETICKAFGPCWGQFVVFSNFKVVIFKIQVSNLRFLTLRYVFRKSIVPFHFLKWLWNLLKFPFYRISIFDEI